MVFDIREKDIIQTKNTLLISKKPLRLKVFPKKEKRKYILLCMIVHLFDEGVEYKECEVNDKIRPVYDDFVTIRRYLVDYKLLSRTDDCKQYWLNINKKDYIKYL